MLGGPLSYSSQSFTMCNVSQHLLAAISAQVWISMDEHLLHLGLSKRSFLRGHIFRSSEDGRECMLAHLLVALCVLHYEVYELDWSRSQSPLNVLQLLRWSAV
ncbi:hypothetical protein AVEN_250290-1 [Araneus ventricosus]|uniref:Uncharacterized protein n=1 Tax=Araneus ventricosus TaxID=182803 RepID=A0A4Y2FKA5_ARAVE|nr:hypothetical protein AVEN_250290-1 [Araneus ventricosus]